MSFSKELQSVVSSKFPENVLINIIQDSYNLENVVINNVTFKSDVKKGDSYLSIVSSFTVNATGNKKGNGEVTNIILPIISKSLPKNLGWRKTFRSVDFFNNETIFYNTVWNAMNQFQLSKNIKPVFHEIPLCISAFSNGVDDYVALENMCNKGFAASTRSNGLDFEHTLLIMKLFARFHALGLAFKDQMPNEFERIANSLEETYFSEKYRKWYSNFQIKNLFPVICDAVKKQLPEFYLKKLQNVIDNDCLGKLINYCATKGPLAVITHGDAWAPNFLWKYDQNNVLVDVVMIDFQLTRYASLALDITFFLYSCTEQELRLKYWDILIEEYHKTFVSTLVELGSRPELLTLNALKEEIKSCALFGIGMSMEAVTMSLLEDDDVADLAGIEGDQEVPLENVWIVHPFKNIEKQQRVAHIIKHAVDNDFM